MLVDSRRLLIAPVALSRFYRDDHRRVGASWMTREDRDREMEDYVRYWDLLYDQVFEIVERASTRLVLLGFSQGAATASWIVSCSGAQPRRPSSIAMLRWLPLTRMQVTLVGGTRDKIFPESAREPQRSRLRQHGLAFSELFVAVGVSEQGRSLRRCFDELVVS